MCTYVRVCVGFMCVCLRVCVCQCVYVYLLELSNLSPTGKDDAQILACGTWTDKGIRTGVGPENPTKSEVCNH